MRAELDNLVRGALDGDPKNPETLPTALRDKNAAAGSRRSGLARRAAVRPPVHSRGSNVPSSGVSSDRIERYADLIVQVGANVQPGQTVYLAADVAHLEVARAIAEKAYQVGALRVIPEFRDDRVRLSALRHAPLEGLTTATDWEWARVRALDDASVASIALTGATGPHLFDGVDPHRLAAIPVELAHERVRAVLAGNLAWTVAAAPNPGWAAQVFGEPDVERLWEAVSVPLRLDEPDVVAAWQRHRDLLMQRAAAISALDLDAVQLPR